MPDKPHERRYPKAEIARRGSELYERNVYPTTQLSDIGKIVLIDIESGEWEIDTDEIAAAKRLETRYPDTQIWMVRVGSPYVRRFGIKSVRKAL